MRCARRRPGCLRPGPLESPDAPELLPAESPRPVGAVGRVRSPGASRWRRAGQRCRRRTAVLPRRLERGRSTPGPVGSRPAATGDRPRAVGTRGAAGRSGTGGRSGASQWAQWGSGTRPRIGQERWSDGSCPAGRHTGRRPEDRTGRGPVPPEVAPHGREPRGPPHLGLARPDRAHPAPPAHEGGPGPGPTDRPGRPARPTSAHHCLARPPAGATSPAEAPTRSTSVTARSAPGTTPTSGSASAAGVRRSASPSRSGRGTTGPVNGRTWTRHRGRGAKAAGPPQPPPTTSSSSTPSRPSPGCRPSTRFLPRSPPTSATPPTSRPPATASTWSIGPKRPTAPTSGTASKMRSEPSSRSPTRLPGWPPCASWPGSPPTAAAAGAPPPATWRRSAG